MASEFKKSMQANTARLLSRVGQPDRRDWRDLFEPVPDVSKALAKAGQPSGRSPFAWVSPILTRVGHALRMSRAGGEVERETDILQLSLSFAARVTQLEARLVDVEARFNGHVSGGRSEPAMNYTARGQVLKMARNGQRAEQIAGALDVPRGEVMLLLKLHRRAQPQEAAHILTAASTKGEPRGTEKLA